MIEGLGKIAARRATMKREQIASEIREILPDGFAVVVEDEQIIVRGPRAVTRWLRDPALAMLRDVAGWARAGWFR